MEVPFLGKTYALDLLKILGRGKSTFTGLLNELRISRTTLTNTLQALVDEEYIHKETVGRYTVYRITEKGYEVLQPSSEVSDVLLQHLTDYVATRLEERGLFDKYEIDEKELAEEIEKQAKRLLRDMVENIGKSIAED